MNNQESVGYSYQKSRRNPGIDLLKTAAMVFVVMLHVLGHGGVLKNTTDLSLNYEVAWGLESLAYCAVNVYVMITGFLYADRTRKISSLIELWMEVLFYSILVPAVLFCAGFRIEKYHLFWCFFPVVGNQYWFFNQYCILFLFIPFMKKVCENKQALKTILLLGICAFSIIPVLGRGEDLFKTNGGYSVFWFVFLFWTGAYIKLNPLPDRLRKHAGKVYLASALLLLLSRNILHIPILNRIGYKPDLFYSYTSPLVYICAVCLLSLFSEITIQSSKAENAVKKMASLTFGVYLIHENRHVRSNLIAGRFASFAAEPTAAMLFHVLAAACVIFGICCLIDYLRSLIFRLIKTRKWAEIIGRSMEKKWSSAMQRLEEIF